MSSHPRSPGTRTRPSAPATGAGPVLLLAASLLVAGAVPAAVEAAPPPAHARFGGAAGPSSSVLDSGEPAGSVEPVLGSAPDSADDGSGGDLLHRPWGAWVRDGATLASLLTLDRPMRSAAQELASSAGEGSVVDEVAGRAEWFGDWQSSLPWVVGGSLAVGQLTGGGRGLREGASVLAGAAAASMVNESVNRAVGRGRPSWEEGMFSFDPFRGHASFPSGHTAYVFGVASGIDVVTDGWIPATAAYGVATLTGLSRIYDDRHWLTDVVASAALSTVVSRLTTRRALSVLGVDEGAGGSDAGETETGAGPAGDGTALHGTATAEGVRVEPLVTTRAIGVTIRF